MTNLLPPNMEMPQPFEIPVIAKTSALPNPFISFPSFQTSYETTVTPTPTSTPTIDPCNLFVKNLDDNIVGNTQQLEELFSKFGRIKSCTLASYPSTEISKGYGFVSFSHPFEAVQAINTLNGVLFGKKRLFVNYAEKREDRKKRLSAIFSQSYPPVVPSPSLTIPMATEPQILEYHQEWPQPLIQSIQQHGYSDPRQTLPTRLDSCAAKLREAVISNENLNPSHKFGIKHSTFKTSLSPLTNIVLNQ